MIPNQFNIALVGFAVAGLLSACRDEPPAAPAAPPAVLVQTAAPAAGLGAAGYAGEVRARHEADLGFRVGGKLVARLVDSGASIAAGQPLARLDAADLQLNVAAVRAQASAAESDLSLARAEVDRYQALADRKFVSQAVLDAKVTTAKAAAARLDQARAQLSASANQAGYATLSSDRAGVVTAVLAEAGQVLAAGQPVLRIARPEEKEILIYVPEARLAELRAARELVVGLASQPSLRLRGALRELAAAADPATRTYAARIRLLDNSPLVQLGMTAQVALPSTGSSAIKVPLAALIERGQGPEVWVVTQGKAQRRPVQVAAIQEDGVLLAGGVVAGESVVAVGAHKLTPGQAVRPLPLPAH